MIVSELMEALAQVDPNMQVRVWADHGQTCMKAADTGVEKPNAYDKDEYMPESVHPDDMNPDEEYFEVFEISAG